MVDIAKRNFDFLKLIDWYYYFDIQTTDNGLSS